jgi:hypothetical protein
MLQVLLSQGFGIVGFQDAESAAKGHMLKVDFVG